METFKLLEAQIVERYPKIPFLKRINSALGFSDFCDSYKERSMEKNGTFTIKFTTRTYKGTEYLLKFGW